MAARRFLLLSPLFLFAPAALLVALAPAPLRAEDEPEVPNAKFNFIGEITGTGVSVRSGPSDNYYPTGKLDKGAHVKVVGIKFNWLKIEPPPESFSYVGKAFVDRHSDGKVGKVNNTANVRAGSSMNPMKTTIQTKLVPGVDVKILGEEDEYYRIEPPAGAYLYVSQQYVRPVGPAENLAAAQPGKNDATAGGATANTGDTQANSGAATGGTDATNPTTPAPTDVDAANRQSLDALAATPGSTAGSTSGSGAATQPDNAQHATQPSETAAADSKFEQLEAEFAEASKKPVLDQPVADFLARYQQATQEGNLPESLKRVADARIAALKVREEARTQLLATRKSQEEMEQRNQALSAERQELAERIKETQVDFYTAVGTLRPSSLQQGPQGTMLYRLTDPDTGRTLVYLRSADKNQLASLLNQFVGVRGELRKDPLLRLNLIQPTEAKAIDQSRLGNGIAAAVMPPSLLPKMPTTASNEAQNASAIEAH
jgi:hypothetical protein